MDRVRMSVLVAAVAIAGVAGARPATARGAPDPAVSVPVLDEPLARCPGPDVCLFDLDVAHPDDVVVPGDADRPGNRVRVLLPPGYDASAGVAHPGVLLLHGAGDGSESWTENSDVEAFVAARCTGNPRTCPVVVMPDSGGKHSEPGWYADWHDGSRQWESFHLGHVLPWAREHLAVAGCGDRWGVVGLSMGGFGALAYGARHPDDFGAIASFSGFVDTKPGAPLSEAGFELAAQNGLGAPTSDIFGPQGTVVDDDGWSPHNPTDRARAGDYVAFDGNIWIATGTGTVGGPAGDDPGNPGGYLVEAFIFELHQHFRAAMLQTGTAFHDQSYVGGLHNWPHWQLALEAALPDLLGALAPTCPGASSGPAIEAALAAPAAGDGAAAGSGDAQLPATGDSGPLSLALVAGVAATGAAIRAALRRQDGR